MFTLNTHHLHLLPFPVLTIFLSHVLKTNGSLGHDCFHVEMLAKSSKLWKSAILGRWMVRIGDLALTWSPRMLGRQRESLFVSVEINQDILQANVLQTNYSLCLDCLPLLQKHKPTFPSNGSLFITEPVKIASFQSGLPIRPCTSSKTHHHPSIYLFPTANYFSSYISQGGGRFEEHIKMPPTLEPLQSLPRARIHSNSTSNFDREPSLGNPSSFFQNGFDRTKV